MPSYTVVSKAGSTLTSTTFKDKASADAYIKSAGLQGSYSAKPVSSPAQKTQAQKIATKAAGGIDRLNSYQDGNVGTYDAMGQGAIEMLESITAAEMGQAVPYVEMWQISPSTGMPIHGVGPKPKYPLTLWTVSPPSFGAAADEFAELRERPAVSLESITIKTVNPMGLILYRQLDIAFTVHRPDVLNADTDHDRDTWGALITPGSIMAMEYGWSANEGHVKNPILNGNDLDGVSQEGRSWTVHGRKIIRFAVTNYRFTILPDQQIQIRVSAIEDGDFGIRHTYVVPGVRPKQAPSDPDKLIGYNPEKFKAEFSENAKKIKNKFKNELSKVKKPGGKAGWVVRLEDVFKIFFADPVTDGIKQLGYKNVTFTIGCVNIKAPDAADGHKPHKMAKFDKYIGDYTIPLNDVVDRMSDLISNGTELTAFNFITPFLRILSDPAVWKNETDKQVTMPDIQLRFVPKRNSDGTQDAHIFVIDVKTELMRFTDSDKDSYKDWAKKHSRSVSSVANRDEIRKICLKKGVPYVEMMKGNSWIKDCQFDIVQDELMQSIFINRYYGTNSRQDAVSKTPEQLRDESADHRKTLYSSAIKGQLTCIGNHGMDVMGMYWMDFGVSFWSGPFRLTERTDQIDQSGWWTTLQFVSEGSDPLGSQGRPDAEKIKKTLAPPKKGAAKKPPAQKQINETGRFAVIKIASGNIYARRDTAEELIEMYNKLNAIDSGKYKIVDLGDANSFRALESKPEPVAGIDYPTY